jgi:hypothetical protein
VPVASTVVTAIVLSGCSGGEEQKQVFTAADATQIADVRPVAPGWVWPRNPEKPESSGSSGKSDASDPLWIELKRQTADVADIADAAHQWRDDDKLASLVVGVVGSSSDARTNMAAANAYSRGWGERTGRIIKDEEFGGLGDEAWRLWVVGVGTQVTYHWRRGNLVLEVHVHCFGTCPSDPRDIDAAAIAWVDAIDQEVRARS